MAKAVICPVCKGAGYTEVYDTDTTSATSNKKACHGCEGKGWVVVPEDGYYPYCPPYYPYYPPIIWQYTASNRSDDK